MSINTNTYEAFVSEHINIPEQFKEPFCPFCGCYCNAAYNEESCFHCEECQNAYFNKEDEVEDLGEMVRDIIEERRAIEGPSWCI